MKIIFMGTPEFSCPTLQILINDPEIEILAVYTKEPAISGRGHKIINSAIHQLALKNNLKIITPRTLKDDNIKQEFIDLKADAAVVVAYGLILPQEILNGTKFGCINIHPSLLPKWRGAAPIQRSIMAGDTQTGICIIKMDQGVDSGDIIYQENFPLDEDISYKELAEKCSKDGAKILLKTLKEIANGNSQLTKQDDSKAVYAHKIDKTEAKIDWSLSAQEIGNKIRGLNGNIGAYFEHNEERIKILKSTISKESNHNKTPGELEIINNSLVIHCQTGTLSPLILQKAGKGALEVKEFLKGFRV